MTIEEAAWIVLDGVEEDITDMSDDELDELVVQTCILTTDFGSNLS